MRTAPVEERTETSAAASGFLRRYELAVLDEIPRLTLRQLIGAIARHLGAGEVRVRRNETFSLSVPTPQGTERVWIKVFGFRNVWDFWRTPWVLSKAERAVRAAELAAAAGVKTPRPLACFVPRRHRRLPSVLVTRHFPYDETLRALLLRIRGKALESRVAAMLGSMMRDLHEAGVVHNDLNDANVVVRRTGSKVELGVLDLNRAHFARPGLFRGLADLARLRFEGRARRALVEGYTGSRSPLLLLIYLVMEHYSRLIFALKAHRPRRGG